MPSSDTNAKAAPAEPVADPRRWGTTLWYHDASGPRRQPDDRDIARVNVHEQPVGVSQQELTDRPAFGFVTYPANDRRQGRAQTRPSFHPRFRTHPECPCSCPARPRGCGCAPRRRRGTSCRDDRLQSAVKMKARHPGRIAETNDVSGAANGVRQTARKGRRAQTSNFGSPATR